MAAPSNPIEAARQLLTHADELLADARRINDIADRIQDTATGNELKTEVRQLVLRAQKLSKLAGALPGPLRKGYSS